MVIYPLFPEISYALDRRDEGIPVYDTPEIREQIEEGEIEDVRVGKNAMNFDVLFVNTKMVIITFIFDDKYYVSKKVIKK